MAGTGTGGGGSGRKNRTSRNHAAAAGTPTLDAIWGGQGGSARKAPRTNGGGGGGTGSTGNGGNNGGDGGGSSASASNNASASASARSPPTFNPARAARRMMGQETPPKRNQPESAAAASASASPSASPASQQAAALNPARAAIERARQGLHRHRDRDRGASPSKSSRRRKRHKSSSSSSSPAKSPLPSSSSSPSRRAAPGQPIDLSMDSSDEGGASKSGGNGNGGTKRKNGASNINKDNGDDGFAVIVDDDDDDDDGNENRINGSEDSTVAKQQARRRSKKTKTGGLSDAGAGAGTGSGRSEVIDMAASRDDDDVVEVAAAASAATGKRKRGGVKSKTNGAAAVARSAASAAAANDPDVVVVVGGNADSSARASASTAAAPASPTASNPAAVPSRPAQAQPLPLPAATSDTHGLALVRIDKVAEVPSRADVDLTPQARDRTAHLHPLWPKAVLGRTGAGPSQISNKIDLGIGNDADGVSRRQVRVKDVSVEGRVVVSGGHHQPSNRRRHRPHVKATVFNPQGSGIFVGVSHYGPPRYELYRKGVEFTLNVGDCIVFDAYNASTTGGRRNNQSRSAHVFRLVRYDKRDAPRAGASPPSAPAPALVADLATDANSARPITAAAKRGEEVPITDSAAAAPVRAAAGTTKSTSTSISIGAAKPPHIPTSAAFTPRSGKIVDTADIDKTVPRASISSVIVASMTERQERPQAAAKAPANDDDKAASKAAPRAAASPEASNAAAVASTGTEPPAAKKSSRKAEENASKLPPQPSVGDRFSVEFESAANFFGVLETQRFCGTAEEISAGNNKYEVNVRFDDDSIARHVYPADDVEMLVDSNGAGAAPTATASQGRSRRKSQAVDSSQSIERVEAAVYPDGSNTAVFDSNPSELFVGDLVDCYYQNGKINGAWYRGRVARVQISTESGKPTLFDVAYNDQEYEKDIPLEHGNVRLFQRGSDDLSWLCGADLLRSSGRSKNATKVGIIKSSAAGAASSTPKVVVELIDGTTEEHNYVDIVQEMFATYSHFVPAGKVKVWPTATAEDAGVRAVKAESPDPNVNEEPAATDGDETDDFGTTKSKNAARKTTAVTFTSTQLDDMLNDHGQSQHSQHSFPDSPVRGLGDKPRGKEMHPSMANALWNALNSAEPSSSAILLRHSAAFHQTLPNSSLSQKTFSLMMTGPQNEGVSFRDPNRMELAYDYMRLSLATSQRLEIGPNISSFAPSSWEDIQHILAQPLKETEQMGTFYSIKESDSISAMRKLGEALQTAASGLSCVDELLKDELSDGKDAGTSSNPRRLYMVNPTVRAALDINVREALKVAVRHAIQCWVRHGHFVIGSGDDLPSADSADEDWCAMEARRCLDSLGSIVSHLVWLYCAEEGIELGDNDCSFIVSDALRNELETLHQDSADFGVLSKKKPSVASWKKYSKRAKMWFILSLDKSFASPLQQNLAKMLNLSKDLKPLL